ncbi:serine/threonine-protein kinase [Streptomyces sp. NBRC 109706]|uniref:serine/threonine-protein kinase n=1 Tax=Streptomyces sp. NBRC 109706 TaxID=1550035 RepID=UPI001F1CBAAC|nr:serine/threonine-protein kinase [Streptomyces sp. NBRC 109706]
MRELAEGGMGEVWEARDERLGRPVAVKMVSLLAGGGHRGDEARARFLREARLTAQLQHPNIVTIHDLGETGTGEDTVPFLVMELIRGEGLDAKLLRGPTALPDAARWGARICDALAEAHDAGVMHRDIKPSNILVTPAGDVKVLDFGIARAADPHATAGRLTRTGFIVGTPAYMAPEQARGVAEPSSDLYALGCLLFELITGRLPFRAPDALGYVSAHLTDEPPAPSSVSEVVPRAWDDLLLTLLRKDPKRRHRSAADLAEALRRLERAPQPPPSAGDRTRHDPTPGAPAPRESEPPTREGTAATRIQERRGAPPAYGNDAPVDGRAAITSVTLALLCVPPLLYMIFMTITYLQYRSAPTGAILANMVVGIVEAVLLVLGALSLFRRRTAGRRIIATAGAMTAAHCLSASAQHQLLGGPESVEVFAVFVAPPVAVAAGVAAILAVLPSTRRWCLRGPDRSAALP